MNQPCLFNLEHYDCLTTEASKCYAVLDKKYSSNLTTPKHRQVIPRCAERIMEKGNGHYAGEARVIANKCRADGSEIAKSEENIIFSVHLPGLEKDTWQSFIQQKGHEINPYRLSLFLREEWKKKKNRFHLKPGSEKEEEKTVTQVEIIIELILDSFNQDKARLINSMKVLSDEIQDKQREYKEKETRKKVQDYHRQKDWDALYEYLRKIKTEGFPGEFIHFISEMEEAAQEGKKWLEIKNRCVEFLSTVVVDDLEKMAHELNAKKQEFQFLFTGKEKWGKKEDESQLGKLADELYLKILGIFQTVTDPEEQFLQIERAENQFLNILPLPPQDWRDHKDQLICRLSGHYSQTLKQVMEHQPDMEKLKQEMEQLEEKVKTLHLAENIDEIGSVRQRLNQLQEYADSLTYIFSIENPFELQYQDSRLLDLAAGIKKIEPFITNWAVFKSLEVELQESQDTIIQTVQIIEEIDRIIGMIKAESRKILHNDLKLDIYQFREEYNQIETSITQLVEAHRKVKFLKPLKVLLEIVNLKLFSQMEEETGLEKEYIGYDLYQVVDVLVKAGESLRESLEPLCRQPFTEPVQLLDGFIEIIENYRSQDFMLTVRAKKEILEIIVTLKKRIDDLIESVLSPIKQSLIPFIPLTPHEKLEEFSGRLQALKEKIPGTGIDYGGYEDLFLPFEQQVQEMGDMIQLQQFIHRQEFATAIKYVKENAEARVAFKDHMMACIYYYEHLENREWADDLWFDFFDKFAFPLSDDKGDKEGGILKKYEELFQAKLPGINPQRLHGHYKNFNSYLKQSPLFPYLMFITDQGSAEDLVYAINSTKNKKAAKKVFPLFHQYIIDHQLWGIYVRLYRACDSELVKHFSSNPMKIVHDSLAVKYQELREKFIAECCISLAEIETFYKLIPDDEEFRLYRSNHKTLEDLYRYLQEITQIFQQFENRDIWRDEQFKMTLNELERKCNRFKEEFAKIRENMCWESNIRHLQNLYNQGRKINETFKWKENRFAYNDLALLEKHEHKNSMDYSGKLQDLLRRFIQLWQDFQEKLVKLPYQFQTLKEVYNEEYFDSLLENWRKSELWSVWQKRDLPGPKNFEDFFNMLQRILDNHEAYLEIHKNGDKKILSNEEKTDPYIIFMEEKENKENYHR